MRNGPAESADLRMALADVADVMADLADEFATILERSAERGDAERRLRIAAIERRIAERQHRNATKIREANTRPLHLEHLPSLLDKSGPDRI
jgi:dsDNA-binding SOS-regulon protein